MHREGADTSCSAHLASLWTTLPPGLTVWDCFCLPLSPTALPHPTLLHSNHRLYVEREINIILCLMVCFIVFVSLGYLIKVYF